MLFYTHLAFGFLAGLLYIKFFGINSPYIFLILVCLASIFPDIDMPRSKIGRKSGFLSKIIEFCFGHRGIFHTIYPAILLFILFLFLNQNLIAIALLVGYLSHLLIDGLSVMGINFLHPLANLRLQGFIETGTILETILFILLLILDFLYVFRVF